MTNKQKKSIEKRRQEIKKTLTMKQMKEWKKCAKWCAEYFGEFGGMPF